MLERFELGPMLQPVAKRMVFQTIVLCTAFQWQEAFQEKDYPCVLCTFPQLKNALMDL